jgi:Domain of unknown function (DUF4936)
MRELFVYYRVRVGSEAIASTIVEAFQAGLKQHIPQLAARLLRRPPAPAEAQTWMEIYAVAPGGDGITPAHQQAIEAAALALAPHLDGPRHTEVFIPVERA